MVWIKIKITIGPINNIRILVIIYKSWHNYNKIQKIYNAVVVEQDYKLNFLKKMDLLNNLNYLI